MGVQLRLEGLKIDTVFLGIQNKLEKLNELVSTHKLNLHTSIYIGDDMPDLACMQQVALPCAPTDACLQAIEVAKYISPIKGGEGCVREIIEKVLTLKGDWE